MEELKVEQGVEQDSWRSFVVVFCGGGFEGLHDVVVLHTGTRAFKPSEARRTRRRAVQTSPKQHLANLINSCFTAYTLHLRISSILCDLSLINLPLCALCHSLLGFSRPPGKHHQANATTHHHCGRAPPSAGLVAVYRIRVSIWDYASHV